MRIVELARGPNGTTASIAVYGLRDKEGRHITGYADVTVDQCDDAANALDDCSLRLAVDTGQYVLRGPAPEPQPGHNVRADQ